jgi:hypothetical protein
VRIAVVQHRERDDAADGARVLAEAAVRASEAGAEAVFFPATAALRDVDARAEFLRLTGHLPGTRIVPVVPEGVRERVFEPNGETEVISERLGKVALLYGDACFRTEQLERMAAEKPAVLVMVPRSESELQAEAALELALGLSESTSGLVIVAETTGGDFGKPSHGSSAIIHLGDMMAEAYEDDEILYADVFEPVPMPEPASPLPEVPTILQQRLASHEGRRPDPGYLADLS